MQKKRAAAALLAAAMILGVPAQAGSRGAFSDVPEKHWAFAAIEQAYADGVMTGTYYDAVTGVRQFSPEGSLSMAEWLSMLTRACWPEEVASAPASGSWYAGAVAVAEHHGLLDGVEDVPLEGALTRNAMAVVIRHVLEEQGVAMPDEEALRDTQAKIGDWAQIPAQYQESVAAVMALGILSGTDSSGTFAGGATFTRAQAAAVYGRLEGVLTAGAGLPSQETTPEAEDPVAAVVRLVNEARAQEGLPPLEVLSELETAAEIRAQELGTLFEHTRPDGRSCFTVLEECGVSSYRAAGENIAMGTDDPERVMELWMNSPGHRANILKSSFTHIGVGYHEGGWVQLFLGK